MEQLKTKVDRQIWNDSVHIWFYERTADGTRVSSNLIFTTVPRGAAVTQEPIRLENGAAQELMDQLWHVGLRPSEGSGSAGSLAATERHLEDMRSLVFKTPPEERK